MTYPIPHPQESLPRSNGITLWDNMVTESGKLATTLLGNECVNLLFPSASDTVIDSEGEHDSKGVEVSK